jgi:glycerophosphoryl diester phosphodiesterase
MKNALAPRTLGLALGLVLGGSMLAAPVAQATQFSGMQHFNSTPCASKLISAHQGYRANADADTVASQTAAFNIGANIADSDVWTTSDGYIVEMHDADVAETTNGHGMIYNLTLDEVMALRTKIHNNPVPTLSDSLAIPRLHQPGRYLMVETKPIFDDHSLLDVLADNIDAAGMQDHVIIYSGSLQQLYYLKANHPEIHVWYKAEGVPPLKQVQGFEGVMLLPGQLTADEVTMYHDAGISVIRQRAAESLAAWNTFLATGADGLMTDKPKLMINFCRNSG